ncbi:tenascin-r [Plakobranchus ocellatus]|uniref:Tenascin-r n=1 Tax=Plakobranchus ocellatus TaxID=259542 RepID=A0AAV4AQB1_9GAST|nr:tenascin-r [Plakobranchus ocellatus]
MEKVLSIIFLMGIISGGNGLQFSLNRHVSTATEKRAACGVLTCEESDTYQTGSTITKMSVFKHKQSGPVTSDKPEGGNLMASVTLEQPLITRESGCVKIDGRLEAGWASLRLELFTKEDCSAEYTCEVRMLDSQEKKSINTYHLLQHRDQGANQVDESVATPAGSLQVLLLFQQLDTKLAMMGSSLESKIGSVENRLEDKIASLYDDMESKIEKRIMDKLHQMDNTLSSFDEAVNNDKIEDQENLQTSLTTLKTGQQKILTNFLVINELFDDGLNSTESKMSSVNRLLAELLAWQQTEYTCEVRMLDSQEKESINTYHLLQYGDQSANQVDESIATPAGSLQLLLLFQQLDTKLAMMGSSLESKIGSVENRLEDKIASLYDDMESKIEKRIMYKLHQMDNTLSSFDEAVNNNKIEHQEDLQTSLTTLKTGQQKILTNFLVINELFDDGLNSTETKMASVNRLLAELLARQRTSQSDCKNLSQVVQQVYSSNGDLANDVKKYFSELYKLQVDFTQLESYISNMSTKMLENVRPKYCRKGAISLLSHPVILPSTETKFSFPYLCDMITDGGGWIVIQRRTTGNVDFYREWATYKKGFGSLDDNFWLGNDNIHTITSSGNYELRVDLKFQGTSAFAHYSKFSIDGEEKNYALRLGDYDGTAGDSLNYHNGQAFSTFDKDNDKDNRNCAEEFSGAWWYHGCHQSNLNGKWKASNFKGPRWSRFSGSDPVSYSEMKIRELRDN